LGIPTYGVIACAKVRGDAEKLKKTVAELLYINLGLNFIAYGIFFVLLFRVEKFAQNKPVLVIYSLTILFTTLGIEWLYSALEDFGYITARSIVFKTISLGLMLLVIKKPEDYLLYTCILESIELCSCQKISEGLSIAGTEYPAAYWTGADFLFGIGSQYDQCQHGHGHAWIF
jgi:hypothetical protein